MAKYVMSDIHGCYDEFEKMLKLIGFNDNDELYILGDIFDRGPKPLNILDYIISHKNIHLIKGNHEQLFEQYFIDGDVSLWYHNGGNTTHAQIVQKDYIYEESLYKYIRKLPFIKVIDKFILVHAGVYLPTNYNDLSLDELLELQEEDICTWTRDCIDSEDIKFKDYTIVCGHTPTSVILDDYSKPATILKRGGVIFIDCGCCFPKGNGRLGCLRLDDLKEYYI